MHTGAVGGPREHLIGLSWNDRQLRATACGPWESKLGLPEELYVFLTTEPPRQLLPFICGRPSISISTVPATVYIPISPFPSDLNICIGFGFGPPRPSKTISHFKILNSITPKISFQRSIWNSRGFGLWHP